MVRSCAQARARVIQGIGVQALQGPPERGIPMAPCPVTPSTRSVCPSASAAHSAIAVYERAPASTAHIARPRMTASR